MELNAMVDAMLKLASDDKDFHGFTCDCGSMWSDCKEVVIIFDSVDIYFGNDHAKICEAIMAHQPDMNEWCQFIHSIDL